MEFDNVKVNIAKNQGNIGVARAVYEYTKQGCTVLAPLSDSDKYDLVIDDGTNLFRVQVKTSRCRSKSGGFNVNLKTSGGNTKTNSIRNRQETDYDVLFVLIDTGDCWSIPTSELGSAGTAIVVGNKKYSDYKL